MSQKTQTADGVWNETGVFSAALAAANSALINGVVCLDPTNAMSCAALAFTSAAAGPTGYAGVIGVPNGKVCGLSINSKMYRFVAVGALSKPAGQSRSAILGQKA